MAHLARALPLRYEWNLLNGLCVHIKFIIDKSDRT